VIRLAVRVRRRDAEIVLAELLELAPGGVEEVGIGETVEYAVYGAPGELPKLPDLRAVVGDTPVEVSSTEIADDWAERWKRFHRPVLIKPPRGMQALYVRPPWEPPSDREDAKEIVIDPGQAFGTGAHATTRLCLELLLELASADRPAGRLLDVGTGSGVLAIAAAGLGFDPVLALDNEQESVEAARENAAVNNVRIEVRRFEVRSQQLPWMDEGETPAAGSVVVLANLLRPLLLELAGSMARAPHHLVAGGLLREEVDEIASVFADRLQLQERQRRVCGEWAAVWFTD
jgi:ribosomal protein L11 methyltransferase